MGRCFQVVVGCAGRETRVFPRAAHGEMVKALEGFVREAHQFMHGIVEETAPKAFGVALTPSPRGSLQRSAGRLPGRGPGRSCRFPKIDGDSDREPPHPETARSCPKKKRRRQQRRHVAALHAAAFDLQDDFAPPSSLDSWKHSKLSTPRFESAGVAPGSRSGDGQARKNLSEVAFGMTISIALMWAV